MPTEHELSDLIDKCDWVGATKNGVNGWIVRGRDDYAANSIFLPCAGHGYETSLNYSSSCGYYWSSVLNSGYYYYACALDFTSGAHSTSYYYYRYYGQTIRPVQSPTE